MLRDQTDSIKAQASRRRKTHNESNSDCSIFRHQLTHRPLDPIILPSLAESEESHALSFFVSTFVLFSRDTQADRGFLEHLPHLFGNLRVGSPLSLALLASSRTLYSKWERQRKDVESLTYPYYGMAIEATRMALQDPVERMSDETLMTVCLLGFYEVRCKCGSAQLPLYIRRIAITPCIY